LRCGAAQEKICERNRRRLAHLPGASPEETVPNPKRRHSQSRQGKRRAHDALVATQLVDCPKCHEKRLAHTACTKCGYYKGRRVIEVAEVK